MSRTAWRPSISLLVTTIVVAPVVLVSALLVWLSWSSSSQISENLAQEAVSGAARNAETEVRRYLGDAVRLSDRYTRALAAGALPDPPGRAWERTMLDDLATTPSVASICYGNARGDATWMLRGQQRLELGRAESARENGAVEYVVDTATGATVSEPLRVYTYDPRTRPWWGVAATSDGPRWTPIYSWFAGNNNDTVIGTGYTRRVTGPNGSQGVIVVDVTLGALSGFLSRMDLAAYGRVYIVDGDDRLVAASHGRVMGQGEERATLGARLDLTGAGATINGAAARVRSTNLRPYAGIDWRLVIAVPESAFMREAHAVRRNAVIAGAAVALAGLLLGVWLARSMSKPVVEMTRHVRLVGAGKFDERLNLHAARELTVLSDEINAMAGGLKQRMVLEQSLALAMQVQQSLLPTGDPTHPTLDVAGRSCYCETTGGDYFDFIEVAPLPGAALLVAVGDVMGHGIAAALLMATARGALRTNAPDAPGLGSLMTRVNRTLVSGNAHNRFMTLALLRIDGETGAVAWASAGHDPAVVYDPTTDAFTELEGGDVPLGVSDDAEYAEYTGVRLAKGGVLVVATDGVWESFNTQGEQYGKERLLAVMRTAHALPAAGIAERLNADLAQFRGERSIEDDVTFVIVKLPAAGAAPR